MRKQPDLKSCPDCDGPVRLVRLFNGSYYVKCKKCKSMFLPDGNNREEVAHDWNEHRDEWRG